MGWCENPHLRKTSTSTRARHASHRPGDDPTATRDHRPVSTRDQYICAFCGEPTTDDPGYIRLDLSWVHSQATQTIGAHHACLAAALQPGFPLAVEGLYE